MKDLIFQQCRHHFNDIVAIRRDIHQYPELGFDVHRTAGIAADALQALGIPVKTGIGRTGVVGDLEVPAHQNVSHCERIWTHSRFRR